MLVALLAMLAGAGNSPKVEFRLQDYRGQWHSSADFAGKKATVLAFIGAECPLAATYTDRLVELEKKYATKGVAFVLIDANQQDSLEDLTHFAKKHEITIPLLKDVGNALADKLGAERTPE